MELFVGYNPRNGEYSIAENLGDLEDSYNNAFPYYVVIKIPDGLNTNSSVKIGEFTVTLPKDKGK